MQNLFLKFYAKLSQALNSKTFWLIVATFLINGVPTIRGQIPAQFLPYVDLFLALVTTLTHINPSQDYSAPVIPDTTEGLPINPID